MLSIYFRSLKYFDPPKMSEICQVSPTYELETSPVRREPFFLSEALHRSICGNNIFTIYN